MICRMKVTNHDDVWKIMIPLQPLSRYKSARNLPRRYNADRRFKLYTKVALLIVMLFLATLLTGTLIRGLPAFQKTQMGLDIHFDRGLFQPMANVN